MIYWYFEKKFTTETCESYDIKHIVRFVIVANAWSSVR